MSKVKGSQEINVKRLYLEHKFDIICPHCGFINNIDLDDKYLSYPRINSWDIEYACCEKCDEEFEYKLRLEINIKTKGI